MITPSRSLAAGPLSPRAVSGRCAASRSRTFAGSTPPRTLLDRFAGPGRRASGSRPSAGQRAGRAQAAQGRAHRHLGRGLLAEELSGGPGPAGCWRRAPGSGSSRPLPAPGRWRSAPDPANPPSTIMVSRLWGNIRSYSASASSSDMPSSRKNAIAAVRVELARPRGGSRSCSGSRPPCWSGRWPVPRPWPRPWRVARGPLHAGLAQLAGHGLAGSSVPSCRGRRRPGVAARCRRCCTGRSAP